MSWVAVAVVGSAVVGGVVQSNAADKGANATRDANNMSIGETRRQFDTTRQDMMPWLQAGNWALDEQKRYLQGDYSGFTNSPDYKAALDMGFKGLERGMAAGGALGSGGADADRIALGQQLASQYAGNYWSKLAGLSNTGQGTAVQLGQFGANAANQIGNSYQNIGNARASAYTQQGNAWANSMNNIGGAVMYQYGRRPGS